VRPTGDRNLPVGTPNYAEPLLSPAPLKAQTAHRGAVFTKTGRTEANLRPDGSKPPGRTEANPRPNGRKNSRTEENPRPGGSTPHPPTPKKAEKNPEKYSGFGENVRLTFRKTCATIKNALLWCYMPNQTNYTIRKGEKQPLFKAADFVEIQGTKYGTIGLMCAYFAQWEILARGENVNG